MNTVKVLVTGSRKLAGSDVDMKSIFDMFAGSNESYHLTHSSCCGADMLASQEAARRGWETTCAVTDWSANNRSAGHYSMLSMIKKSDPEIVIGFIKGQSTGVKKCLKLVKKTKNAKLIYLWDNGSLNVIKPDELNNYI